MLRGSWASCCASACGVSATCVFSSSLTQPVPAASADGPVDADPAIAPRASDNTGKFPPLQSGLSKVRSASIATPACVDADEHPVGARLERAPSLSVGLRASVVGLGRSAGLGRLGRVPGVDLHDAVDTHADEHGDHGRGDADLRQVAATPADPCRR